MGMPWLERHNPEIDWKTGEVKMTRCPEECGKQWRPVQEKSEWEKQKEEEAKEEVEKKKEEKKKKKKQKRGRTVEVRKVAEEWEIWDEEEEAAKSEEEAKKLVLKKFHRWIWKEAVGEDAYKKVVGSCDRRERGVYTKKRKSISFVERRERGDKRVCERTVEEWLHLAV